MTDKTDLTPTPTVSRVLADGSLVELLYDAAEGKTSLGVAGADGAIDVRSEVQLASGECLIPYSAQNNLITNGCVLLPSGLGEFETKSVLLAEIRAYLHRYVDLSALYEEICAHYVLLSWVYDAFNEMPYIRFRGDYGTGKTRALLAVGSICYKPFFASGASTVSPIFHVLDAFQGTLVLDEADFRFTDQTAGLTKILNNGNVAGLPVLRTMTNRHKEFNPRAFRVYGPKLVGMRERFSDAALESRFLTEETGLHPLRPEVPIHLPPSLALEAQQLRNKLLAYRFKERAGAGTDASRVALGIEPRLNQTALSLLSVVDDAELRAAICAALEAEDDRVHQERSASLEAVVVEVLVEALGAGRAVTVAGVTASLNQSAGEQLGRSVTPKWVGWFLRNRLKLTTTKSQGVFVVPSTERAKMLALAKRYGVDLADARAAA